MESKTTWVSVVIPAHNEEKYIQRCLQSILRSAAMCDNVCVEMIVICNRCTDQTAYLANLEGARVLHDEHRCIAKTRNTGIFAAMGDVIITIDADNQMTEGTISEIIDLLEKNKVLGGGSTINFERYSLPLFLNDMMCRIGFAITGYHCGMFWTAKKTFEEIGGFVETRAMEDVLTAKKLKQYARKHGKRWIKLKKNYMINSTRKFDDLGDWIYFKMMFSKIPVFAKALLGKTDELDKLLDEMFYAYSEDG